MTVPRQQKRDPWRPPDGIKHPLHGWYIRTERGARTRQTTGATVERVLRNPANVTVSNNSNIANLVVKIGHRHPGDIHLDRTLPSDNRHGKGSTKSDSERAK